MLSTLLNPATWYWGAAGAHALLLAYVLVAGGRGLLRGQLMLLAAMGAIWSSFLAETTGGRTSLYLEPIGSTFEIAYLATWFLLLHRLLRGPYNQSMPEVVRRSLMAFWILLVAIGVLAGWYWYARAPDVWVSGVFSGVGLTAAVSCLALAAQLSRDAPVESRSALKLLVAAAGLATGAQVFAMGVALLGSYMPPAILLARARE